MFLANRMETDKQANKKCDPLSCIPMRVIAQPLTWLPLFTAAMGMYLMNGYLVLSPFTAISGERVRD